MELAKRQLAENLQALNRLEVDHKVAERQAKEAETMGRDRKVEAVCRAHLAALALLRSVLGISSIGAPTPTCLRSVYKVQDAAARRFCVEVAVLLHFAHPGGRIKGYEVGGLGGKDGVR